MDESKEMQQTNKLKPFIEEGDLCISETFGIGYVDEIEPLDCWYPISIKFQQKIWLFGEWTTKYRFHCYNTDGQTDSITVDDYKQVDCTFYKKILGN